MSKLFVLPDVGGSTNLSCIQLKHPKDESLCTYYYEPKENCIYELVVQQNRFYSWFLNNDLNNDGNFHLVTLIDPLFLLIPLIYKEAVRFQNLFDIFSENACSPKKIELLQKLYPKNVLKCIADVKDFEDDVFIKFSQEKTLKWLELKFKNIVNSLVIQGIGKNLSGFKVSNYVSGENNLSEDEYKVLAFELISDYIPPDIENTLRQQLNIPDCNKIASTTSSKVTSNKRKIESDNDHKTGVQSVHSNDAYDRPKQVESNNKKQKFSRSQRELSKVDKSGMKSIASYFKKK